MRVHSRSDGMLNCCEAPATIAFISLKVDLTLLRVDLILFIIKFSLHELAFTVSLAKKYGKFKASDSKSHHFFYFRFKP